MKCAWPCLFLLLLTISLPSPAEGQFRYGVLMYYDLCPWQFCGCPFCVQVPTASTARPRTTSTIFDRQEELTTTTVVADDDYYDDETTTTTMQPETDTTASDAETLETTEWTTTQVTETEPPEDTEEPETEAPETEEPPPIVTPRPSTTTTRRQQPQQPGDCPYCVCRTWSQRVHQWNVFRPPAPTEPRQRASSCPFCGRNWLTSGAWGRKPGYYQRFFDRQQPINRWNRWGEFRWRFQRLTDSNTIHGGRTKSAHRQPRPLRSFNQFGFGNGLLFG